MKKIRVVSWNIAGGRKIRSSKRFDYGDEDIKYFASNLKNINPDFICLQEVHFNNNQSTSSEICKILHDYKFIDFELSPSHIDPKSRLGMSVLSKSGPDNHKNLTYPYPEFDLHFPNGRLADRHDKGLQVIDFSRMFIANTQLLPLGIFGHYYDTDEGLVLAGQISDIFINNLSSPLIFCGDFGSDYNGKFYEIFKNVIKKFGLKDALMGMNTRNLDSINASKVKADYIFYSSHFKLLDSGIIETETDHFLCYADFEIK